MMPEVPTIILWLWVPCTLWFFKRWSAPLAILCEHDRRLADPPNRRVLPDTAPFRVPLLGHAGLPAGALDNQGQDHRGRMPAGRAFIRPPVVAIVPDHRR